tara:strand:- start:365 stop:730 length:366 start_codon:yes stop_codon:yes gene_type:complete
MSSKYFGKHEYGARLELLQFLTLLWMLDKKRFSRNMLIKALNVPYSIARSYSQGKGKNVHECYRKLSDVDTRTIKAIKALVAKINEAKRIDQYLGSPKIESAIYKDYRSKKCSVLNKQCIY